MRVFVVAVCVVLAGCNGEASGSAVGSGTEALPALQPIVGGVGWTADPPFERSRAANDMRDAQYSVSGQPATLLTISHFDPAVGGGGEVGPNVERWVGQFRQPPGVEATVSEQEVNDLRVTLVDVRGTFVGRDGMGPESPPRPHWRMRGAIVEASRGLVFWKLLGPEAGVTAASDAFDEMVRSIHPE